jgi:hypothetical protein
VRTLIGSIGLVASVPVTTALAALVVSADRPGTGTPESAPVTPGAASAGAAGPAAPSSRGGKGRRRKH